ncbi:MAG: lysophospholipid acyltransferase family protein, partial [Dehalococcoidia bacterium]
MKSLISPLYYWANISTWVRFLVWLNTSCHVMGLEKIPRKGPLILASNHFSEADPPILSVTFPRRIVWMAKRELFDIPVFGIFYHLYGAIPVRRFEADLVALRQAEDALRRGLALGMFPEGTRSLTGTLSKGYPGTALIA